MSWRRGETSGWTAFDRERRRKLGLESEAKDESFPLISSSMGQNQNTANKTVLQMPFSSVLQDSVKFQIMQNRSDMDKKLHSGSSSASDYVYEINGVNDAQKAHEMLKDIHPWADQSLIDEVLAGINYDVDKASNLLKLMVSSDETSGWTAFDRERRRERRRKLGLESEAKDESFPLISSSMGQNQNTANKTVLEMPFSSVLQDPVKFQIMQNRSDMDKKLHSGSSSASDYVYEINGVNDGQKAHEMLKDLHPWADQSLIDDVLAGVNYDVDKASNLLKLMVSSDETSGWTAFDRERRRERRRKLGLESEAKDESFPLISSSMGQNQNTANKTVLEMPFSSVLQDPVKFQIMQNRSDMDKKLHSGSSSASDYVYEINGVNDGQKAHEMLKDLHPWADQSLIDEVLAGINYDVDKASNLLKLMVSSDQNSKDSKVTGTKELKSDSKVSLVDGNKSPVDRALDVGQVSCLLEGLMSKNNKNLTDEHASTAKMLLHDISATKMILNSIRCLPVEPEWEEDDIYLVHRKEARKMISSASWHSKAAKDAYLRGDHLSARLYSRKAREEWAIAEKLNTKAAKEILSIRNSKNDEWTLDLHGLHAAEAVQALQEHLQKIESQMPMKQFACASRVNSTSHTVLSAAPEVAICNDVEKWGSQIPLPRPRPSSVQVITGKGNHSRGEAALPAAVRSFLIEKRYHYNEARPGVIEVQPKFRR